MAKIYRKPGRGLSRGGLCKPLVVGENFSPISDLYFPRKKKNIFSRARKRRKSGTLAEVELDRFLLSLNNGVLKNQYVREFVLSGKYILDFFFHKIRLGIEVDGPCHNNRNQKAVDNKKNQECLKKRITLMRLKNHEILVDDKANLLQKLRIAYGNALKGNRGLIKL